MWVPIVIALIEWLGPVLAAWFKTWLESRLREKAAQFEAVGKFAVYGTTPKADRLTLLQAVRDDLWFWQIGKRAAVDRCIECVKDESRAKAALFGRIGD